VAVVLLHGGRGWVPGYSAVGGQVGGGDLHTNHTHRPRRRHVMPDFRRLVGGPAVDAQPTFRDLLVRVLLCPVVSCCVLTRLDVRRPEHGLNLVFRPLPPWGTAGGDPAINRCRQAPDRTG
jgi:hypothetical protein